MNDIDNKMKNKETAGSMDILIGRNAVREAIRNGRPADHLLVAKGAAGGSLAPILALCREKHIPIKEADKQKLDFLSHNGAHQGVILFIAAYRYASLEDAFALAESRNEPPFFLLCDGLEDPHNLGAIIRSAEAAGVHGVIIPERRSVSLSSAAGKAAAGALEYVPVIRVPNLNAVLRELKERGLWIYAAEADGQSFYEADFSGPLALIIGSEGKGVSRLLKENADFIVSIPMKGKINSLNASVAAGILMFEAAKARGQS